MTEAEWLVTHDPSEMLRFATPRISGRKLHLFAVACCRLVEPLISNPAIAQLIGIVERHADGGATPDDRDTAEWLLSRFLGLADLTHPGWMAYWAANLVAGPLAPGLPVLLGGMETERVGRHRVADLLREIAGNPFRPLPFDAAWRTDSVAAIARTIYEGKSFAALPILGDALEDAGCDNADVLGHCRQPAEHCRGCWVLDAVLEK
jgi:hypothetical protein